MRPLEILLTVANLLAPVSPALARYPVLIFLSGRGGYRQSNSQQIEALVSHGPYRTVFPPRAPVRDGTEVSPRKLSETDLEPRRPRLHHGG
jgi:hypothetical protein